MPVQEKDLPEQYMASDTWMSHGDAIHGSTAAHLHPGSGQSFAIHVARVGIPREVWCCGGGQGDRTNGVLVRKL